MDKFKFIIVLFVCCNIGFAQSYNYKQLRLFDKLWKKIDNHYPSFELKEVDWNKTYDLIRPKISPTLTQEQLMDTISLMLAPFNDGHVGVSMIKFFPFMVPKDFIAERSSQFKKEFPTQKKIDALFEASNITLQSHGFKPLQYGYHSLRVLDFTSNSKIAYLSLTKMQGVSKRKLKAFMRDIGPELTETDGVILDLRDNSGGVDAISDILTSYFIDSSMVARLVRERKKKSHDAFSKTKQVMIKPNKNYTFTKKVIILTNDRTRSAGEYPVLALKGLPYVTIIGDRTEGMLGGSKIGFLPYGWIYGVNKWKVSSRDNVWYEDIGIPPDLLMQNTKTDLINNLDPIINKAIELIENP